MGVQGRTLLFLCLVATALVATANGQGEPSTAPSSRFKYTAGKIPYFEDKPVITVCASPWTSAVECSLDQGTQQWQEASGYEVEVFKMTMPIIGWTDEMIRFECLPWGEMMDRLENGTCDIAPSGMAPLTERMEAGLKFSDHTLQSGITVMVLAEDPSSRSIWYFFSAMSWEVWIAILLTGFVVGLIVWLMEAGSKTLTQETRYLNSVVWDSVGRPVQMRDYRMASVAGNTVAWVWSFCAFIVMSLYQASLTANMTLQSINQQLTSFQDLQGRTVGTWEDYVGDLQPYGARIVSFPWDSPEDEQRMLDALVTGEISALVLDETALRNLDANNCSTRIVEDIQPIKVTGQTAGFSNETAIRTISAYNGALRSLMENDQLQQLRDEFIYVQGAACKDQSVNSDYMIVTWYDVAGLWVILAGSVGVALLVIALYRLWHHGLRTRMFLKSTVSIGRGVSRSLTLIADKNMSEVNGTLDPRGSEVLFADKSLRYIDGRPHDTDEDQDLRTLVRELQREIRDVKSILRDQMSS